MNRDRASCWSVTINNPQRADDENIALARQKGWKVEGQMEQGDKEGTPHYQLMVSTPQVRFSAVKKMFPRSHIEVAKKPKALAAYVVKAETRVGALPDNDGKYPSLSAFWNLVYGLQDVYPIDKYPRGKGVRLLQLDDITRCLIEEGYHVESIAINPATRSAYERYGEAIMYRSFAEADAVYTKQQALSSGQPQPAQTQTSQEDRQVEFSSDTITIPTYVAADQGSTDEDEYDGRSATGTSDVQDNEEAQGDTQEDSEGSSSGEESEGSDSEGDSRC